MSDYLRCCIAFPIPELPPKDALLRVAPMLKARGVRLVPRNDIEISYYEDTPTKYSAPALIEPPSALPTNEEELSKALERYRNIGLDTAIALVDRWYSVRFDFYQGDDELGLKTFLRASFPSSLTYALHQTREPWGEVRIDESLKREILGLCLTLARAVNADGFCFGYEGDPPAGVVTLSDIVAYIERSGSDVQIPGWLVAVRSTQTTRKEIVDVWKESELVKESSAGYVLLDLLRDADDPLEDPVGP